MEKFLDYSVEAIKYLAQTRWVYFAYALPLIIFMLVFYIRHKKEIFSNLMSVIKWLKPSFETGGVASPEKLTAFAVTAFAYIPGRLIFAIQNSDPIHLLYGSGIDALFVLVLYRIISPAQIVELKTGIKMENKTGE